MTLIKESALSNEHRLADTDRSVPLRDGETQLGWAVAPRTQLTGFEETLASLADQRPGAS
jgi:hypothetical protein